MIIFADGSQEGQGRRTVNVGYGVIAVSGDDVITRSGRFQNIDEGKHETIAFVEAVRFAAENACNPGDVSFYTDCETLGNASFFLHDGNYSHRRNQVISRVQEVCSRYYEKSFASVVFDYILGSRVEKLYSHRRSTPIYHRRADYVAYCAAREIEPTPFDDWLNEGFFFVTGSRGDELIGDRVYAPFTGPRDCGIM